MNNSLLHKVLEAEDDLTGFVDADNFVELINAVAAVEATDHGKLCAEADAQVSEALIIYLATPRAENYFQTVVVRLLECIHDLREGAVLVHLHNAAPDRTGFSRVVDKLLIALRHPVAKGDDAHAFCLFLEVFVRL